MSLSTPLWRSLVGFSTPVTSSLPIHFLRPKQLMRERYEVTSGHYSRPSNAPTEVRVQDSYGAVDIAIGGASCRKMRDV